MEDVQYVGARLCRAWLRQVIFGAPLSYDSRSNRKRKAMKITSNAMQTSGGANLSVRGFGVVASATDGMVLWWTVLVLDGRAVRGSVWWSRVL